MNKDKKKEEKRAPKIFFRILEKNMKKIEKLDVVEHNGYVEMWENLDEGFQKWISAVHSIDALQCVLSNIKVSKRIEKN